VTEIRLFGSYLTDSDDLGDIDLALSYHPRPTGERVRGFTDSIEAFAAKHGKQHLHGRTRWGCPSE
jgi:predicted nucleotidyltransferase